MLEVTAGHWQRIKSLFAGALSRTPQEREAFLEEKCEGNLNLQAEVRNLISDVARADEWLEVSAPPASTPSFAPGDIAAGRFLIVRLLGRGGMGEVYEAEDRLLGENIAIKTVLPEIASQPASLIRFHKEIQLARRISHPNVCRIFDLETHEGDAAQPVIFLTMELLSGETLAARIERGGPPPMEEALALGRQMAEGLEAAHRCGVVHRDFKSGNVMLVPGREGTPRAVITDFGLAREDGPHAATRSLTGKGNLLGTLDYMAPEQLEKGEADFRSDIYSLGLVLFEMVTGKLPFQEHGPVGALVGRLQGPAPSPRSERPELSRTWEAVVGRCLERDPARRFGSAAEVARALAPADPRTDPAFRLRRVRRRGLAALAGLVLIIAAGVWLLRTASRSARHVWKPVPLTTYPGVELHSALSPDGELVAFSWEGEKRDNRDIWVRQIASGTVSRLTSDPALDLSPAWSPDGRLVAFRRLRVLAGISQVIVKSYLGGPERMLAEWRFRSEDQNYYLPPSRDICWSPNGRWLVAAGKSAPEQPSAVFAVSADTGETRQLTSPPPKAEGDSSPAVSPDGRTLAFARAATAFVSELYLLPLSADLAPAGDPERVTFDERIAVSPTWTADGHTIIFSSDRNGRARGLWRLNVSAPGRSVPEELEGLAGIGTNSDDPTVSRDGRRLAYARTAADLNIWEAHLQEDTEKLAAAPAMLISSTRNEVFPDYSPDGKKIAFASDRSGHQEIWVCDRDGANAVPLTSSAKSTISGDPHWSPDGKQVVFVSLAENNTADICVVGAQGGAPHCLTHGPADSVAPTWSRDGKWVYFCSNQDGSRQVWKIPASAGNAVQVTKGGGVFARESADGKYIYYSKARSFSGLWKVPVDGGTETEVLPMVSFGRNFVVTERGIYFMSPPGRTGRRGDRLEDRPAAEFLSFATGGRHVVFRSDRPAFMGLALSPDEHSLLYTQLDRQDADLWLVENFH